MTDASAESLGTAAGGAALTPPGGLAPDLREILAQEVVLKGEALAWAGSPRNLDDAALSRFGDLTGWECFDTSFHLEDNVPVRVHIREDGAPEISEDDQRTLLLHGIACAMEFRHVLRRANHLGPVRCIIGANETNATFRFHRIRPGESWTDPDLDRYRTDKIVVVDIKPAAS
ncbi:hypothetical protein [Streptomyces sp. NPDC051909]|uniref:hypothetical protein n=1 Tax=Streptomyces sp. NPDC051909 TaxID=3154944 RepID=UPI00344A6D82